MKIETKFDLGQMVWTVSSEHMQTTDTCRVCKDTKKVVIGPNEFICPACDQGRHRLWLTQHYVGEPSSIGKITYEQVVDAHLDYTEKAIRIHYMLEKSGVGSGTCWPEADLYATQKEAQDFCDTENNRIEDRHKKEQALVDSAYSQAEVQL